MASFVSQSQKYDSQEIELIIADLEKELQDEVDERKSLDDTTVDKIAAAEKFMSENSDKIKEQLAKIQSLDADIRKAVSENIKLEGDDAKYKELVSSQQYVDIANDIASIKSVSKALADFLVQNGRRGRPVPK